MRGKHNCNIWIGILLFALNIYVSAFLRPFGSFAYFHCHLVCPPFILWTWDVIIDFCCPGACLRVPKILPRHWSALSHHWRMLCSLGLLLLEIHKLVNKITKYCVGTQKFWKGTQNMNLFFFFSFRASVGNTHLLNINEEWHWSFLWLVNKSLVLCSKSKRWYIRKVYSF